ncbi:D-alanyl-D-alanine carboxypeptidase [Clostridiales bacterium BX7]|uniref:serine-type D-Ala-D-Ala carboxypeptidase n=1 Tax=Feifania hominis TaxID=2763660 RepID=A0A926DEB4_9FIRM|nr:D-alanyl-D-alanine carboxypeptidase [Feifania hominis]
MTVFFLVALLLLSCFSTEATALEAVPSVRGENILLVNTNTDRVVYSKNADEKIYPGGMVKIMTAILVLENIPDLDLEITVYDSALQGISGLTTAGLKKGEVISIRNLLYCMLLRSGADACNVLAEQVSGSTEEFVKLMNQKAAQIGCTNTQYTNTHGLDDDQQYTTAEDLYKIARYAMKTPGFMEIADTQYKQIPKTNLTGTRYYYHNNYMIVSSSAAKVDEYYYRYANGILSGSTPNSGYCVIASAQKNEVGYVCIVMNSERDAETKQRYSFIDAKALLEYAYDNYSYECIIKEKESVAEAPVELASTTDTIVLTAKENLYSLIPSEIEPSDLERVVTHEQDLVAPIEKDTQLGEVVFRYDGVEYGRMALVAQKSVERSTVLYIIDGIGRFLTSTWFRVGIIALVLLVVLYFVLTIYINRRRRTRRIRAAKRRSRQRYRRPRN